MSEANHWWWRHLEAYREDGRKDAEMGIYRPPHDIDSEDPQDQDEAEAYHDGFMERRRELDGKR